MLAVADSNFFLRWVGADPGIFDRKGPESRGNHVLMPAASFIVEYIKFIVYLSDPVNERILISKKYI